eukprot:CCRYP_020284-RA/>CCRYP_020284-RA protein AED:0.07 eAED:0.07 QI:0/0.5/0.2/1/1/1/5/346/1279
MTTAIPLKHWIKVALESSSIGNGAAALSPAYFASALRIAIDLTRQISDVEQLSDSGLFHGIASLPPPFPVACIDWADCITVSLKPHDEIGEHGESSLQCPSPASLSDSTDDLDELLDKIAQEIENDETELPNENEDLTGVMKQHGSDASYFNVECARIFYCNVPANRVDSNMEKLQRIYSLGLVFYQLFSGGEQPPVELLVVASPNGGNLAVVSASLEEGEEQKPASCSGLTYNDFASTLNMSDDTSLDGSSLLGGILNDVNVEHYESNNGYHTTSSSNKRQALSSRSRQNVAPSTGAIIYNVPVDCLSMKGVPRRLCDVICNMIDCINGDFMGNESYSGIADVTSDLQLMLDKPSIYLHDLDVDKLSQTGLELNDTVFERNDELASLKCSYLQSIRGSAELAIITGMSGTGKSTMANQLGSFITANGGVFLSGKFDLQQVMPYSAVASAFNSYVDVFTRVEESELAMMFASKMRMAMGADLFYLIQVIPNLSQLIHESSTDIPPNQDDCVDAQQRLQYLFCQFVEVISSCSGAPITLFMDDVQWADSASMSIIGQLLKASRTMQHGMPIFFLGACRNDKTGSDHAFWKMIEDVGAFGFKTTLVKLNCLDKDTVTHVVSNLLHLSHRLVGSLSDIVYHKTKGNPLFVSKMLLSLNREGLLRLSLTRNRWEWDEVKIQSRKLPDDVATLLVHNINALPIDAKTALGVLSCFGASTACEVIRALETDLDLNLIEPLNIAIVEGFVDKFDERFCFCHDRILEASYSMIEAQDRCLHHMNYGAHWSDQYDLSLELFNLAAKCALAIKDLTSLTMICDELSRNARKCEDTLNSSFVLMSALTHSRISESVQFGFRVLSQLGVHIPNSSSRDETMKLISQTKSSLDGISLETLLNYRILTDYKKDMAMKFLAKLENSVQQTNTSLQPLVTIKIIQLTVEHGLSPMSAIGFAYFGGMLAELGDIQEGYQYTKLANALLDKNHSNEIAGELIFLSAELRSYMEPLQVINDCRLQGQATAMAAGDVHWACMNKLMCGDPSVARGKLIGSQGRGCQCWAWDEDEAVNTDLLTRNVIENKNTYQLVIVYFQKMFLSLVFNNYDDMKHSAEKFFEFNMPSWHLLSAHAGHVFIGGLVSFRIFRETCNPLWATRGEAFKDRIHTWRDQGYFQNFGSKSFLLEAEEFYSNGNIERAQVLYENAISSARGHKFIHEEAIACELAATFYLNTGNKSMALKYFTDAYRAYFKWGAFSKVKALYAYMQDKFGTAEGTSADFQSILLNTNSLKRSHSS